ncbi:MAG: CBS domain-containing protein [Candidatus Omnitrophica bacterium]|nr:CBS domain-containing protein [Candidatus Omnitrophota bacterium]
MHNIEIHEIMCDHPIKVKESISIGNVAHLLFRYQINGILVVRDDDDKKLVGVFTTTDLLNLMAKAVSEGKHRIDELKDISQKPVGEYSSCDIISLQKTDKVAKAIATMHRKGVHTIPVFDGDELVGVLGRHDVLNIALS